MVESAENSTSRACTRSHAPEKVLHARVRTHMREGRHALRYCHVAPTGWSAEIEVVGSKPEGHAGNPNSFTLMRGNTKPVGDPGCAQVTGSQTQVAAVGV